MPGAEAPVPSEYKFRHLQKISMDGYQGVANGEMDLNDPVADGFMSVADMRYPVFVVSKREPRVVDYDQVGHVRIAKYLAVPRIGISKGEGKTLWTTKEGESWRVEVDDRKIWDELGTEGIFQNQDDKTEEFIGRFRKQVRKGLMQCLGEEKVFNAGNYNINFEFAYIESLATYAAPALVSLSALITGEPLGWDYLLRVAGMFAAGHSLSNLGNRFNTMLVNLGEKGVDPFFNMSSQDPFIRSSWKE